MNDPRCLPLPGDQAPVKKAFRHGTHRHVDPNESLNRLQGLLPKFGITRVANVTGLDKIGVPVIMVCRPNSRSVAVSQGKGLSVAAAKVSGIMESIELYHAEHLSDPLKLGSVRELQQACRLADIDGLPMRAQSRYSPDLPILWIQGLDLISRELTWVPYESVSMNSTLPLPTGVGCFLGTSNGLASGNVLLEAISHAICEVVERDATSLWQARKGSECPEGLIDLESVDDECCRQIIERCTASGTQLLAWDITSDVGIAAVAALITELDAAFPLACTAIGYGCHPDRGIALFRALTEAIQSRLTYISGSRDDLFRREYEDSLIMRQHIDTFHSLLRSPARKTFNDVATFSSDTFDDDIVFEIGQLKSIGISQVIALDLTDDAFGIPVARVVIPGLEGPDSDPDYAKGARAGGRSIAI